MIGLLLTIAATMSAHAGPVPMFTGPLVPPMPVAPTGSVRTAPPTTTPRSGARPVPVVPAPPWIRGGFLPFDPSLQARTLDTSPEPTRPPPLPYVKAAPVKTVVANPGQLTPIDQLPSAFVPLPTAPNQLPPQMVVRPRPIPD